MPIVLCDEMMVQFIKGLIGELDVWFLDKSTLDAIGIVYP
jgi:hypothetical protein